MILVRPARFADVVRLGPRLRVEDALELAGAWPLGPVEGLVVCLLNSDRAFALCRRGEPLALWGISGTRWNGLELGVPWMLAEPALFDHRAELIRRSRPWIDRLLLGFDALTNLTDAANGSHLRWLSWCGFDWLRDHASHGRLGRRFREFYRVNARAGAGADSVREQLLRRPIAAPGDIARPVAALVRLGVPLLAGDDDAARGPAARLLQALPQLLDALGRAAISVRSRRALVRLLAELAPRLVAGSAGVSTGGHGVALDWCECLLELDGVRALTGAPVDIGEAALALEVRERARRKSRHPERAAPAPAAGPLLLQALANGYRRALTLDDQVDPAQGYRLRAAAAGIDEQAVQWPLAVSRLDLVRAFAGQRLVLELEADDRDAGILPPGFLDRRVGLDSVERLRRAAAAGSSVDRAFAATAERWGRHVGPVASLADAGRLAGAMAHAAAGRLLPPLRLEGVVSGLALHLVLYRLLRGALLHALLGEDRPALARLLGAEVGALLVAAGFDDVLLDGDGAAADALRHAVVAIWGSGALSGAELPTLLLPVLSTPVVHGCQLAPALLVWRLAESGGLDALLEELADVFDDRQPGPQRRFQRFLRRRRKDVAMVRFRRLLDSHGNPGSAQRGAPVRVDGAVG
ncbi:MAG: hypothetical protein RIC56_00880 [Pseudomonadales bacterium]